MTPCRYAHAVVPRDWPPRDLGGLLSRCSAGDARARETIIVRFLPLARRLARQYQGRGEPLEDLVQAATIGLIKAVDRYSPDRSEAFAAYARPVILGEIRRHFRDATWPVHVPRPTKERAGRVLRADKELASGTGALAPPEALAKHLGLTPGHVTEARRALGVYFPASLDAPAGAPSGDPIVLGEVIGTVESDYERVEVTVGVERTLRVMKPRDRKIVLLRLACGLTQDEIAGRTGISQMHVSRILRSAGAALRTSCGLAVGGATN